MTERTKHLLEQAETQGPPPGKNFKRWVDPVSGVLTVINLDALALIRRIEALAPGIADILEMKIGEIDSSSQDSYFMTDMAFGSSPEVGLRFSAYGQLFTVLQWYLDPDQYSAVEIGDPSTIDRRISDAIAFVESQGYIYISEDDLAEPYTGNEAKFRNKRWWSRYFDYA